MSKDAKISFIQTVGAMIISLILIVSGFVMGVYTGACSKESEMIEKYQDSLEKIKV